MPLSIEQFAKSLTTTGLVTVDELKATWSAIPADARPKDGDALAQVFVERGKLTAFQAKHLAAGRGGGLVFGEYVLVDEIGAGGMGKVYKARHMRMARIVALKVLSAAAMKDEASVKRFQREARAAARLEHPQIVTAYDAGQAGTTHFLVMQYVDGGDLADLVKTGGPLSVERAVGYIVQAARGLAFAHGEGVIHRDIKPANLLVDKKGVVKILDMGLARIEGAGDGLTATEQVMGTVDYMSPEQASDTKSAGPQSDIYSLGCTLWFLLTGKKLYEGDSLIGRLMKHREAPLPSVLKERDDAPWGVEQALHKMLAKAPADRFASMDEVIAALEPYGEAGGSSLGSGIGSSIGMGSSVGMGGARDAELSMFLKGITSQPGSSSKITANPQSDSRLDVAATVESSMSDTDAGLRPRSGSSVVRAPTTKPNPKRSGNNLPLKLVAGGVVGCTAILGGLLFWLLRSNVPDEPVTQALLRGTAPIAIATASAPAEVAPPAPIVPSIPTTPFDFLTSPDYEWSEPVNLGSNVNSPLEDLNPWLSSDGLTLLFDSRREGSVEKSSDLWMCRRTSPDASWSPAENLGPPLNDGGRQISPSLSVDGLTLFYSTDRIDPSYGGPEICYSTRKTVNDPWSDPKGLIGTINSSSGEESPELSLDGLSLIYHTGMTGGFGGNDLWLSTRRDLTHSFVASGPLRPLANSPGEERSPTLSSDSRVVIFFRPNVKGIGGNDLWMCTRANAKAPWTAPELLPQRVNLTSNEEGPHLSADGKTLLFSSNRGNNTDIWETRRVPRK